MTRTLASALSIISTAAASLAFAVMSSGRAYADDITIDTTPFVSSRTRAEVKAEVVGHAEQLRMASSDWQMNQTPLPTSGYTRAEARADYVNSRKEVNALNAEDSGSSYLARLPHRMSHEVILAGSPE